MTENPEQDALDAAFEGGFDDEQPEQTPAADEPAATPAADTEADQTQPSAPAEPPDLSPAEIRAQLAELQSLRQAVQGLPQLTERLRKAEGRLGDLNARVPVPTPPPPPRLEKLERVREELPEVVEAMEEYFQSRQPKEEPKPAAEEPTSSVLEQEHPGWEQTVASSDFEQWLASQDAAYQQKVKATNSEAVMLAAITRFEVQTDSRRQAAAAAQREASRVAQTRNARAAAAVTPTGAGRRAPSEQSIEAAFEAGFSGR